LAAQHGFIIRNRTAFEEARKIQSVLFDKTGTLTQGKFGVTDILTFVKEKNEKEILKYAASIESHSEHLIAKAIAAHEKGELYSVDKFRAISGKGAEGFVNGKWVKVVSPGYLKENQLQVNQPEVDRLSALGKTVVFVVIEGKVEGAIALADLVRPESKRAIERLKKMGIRCLMITGDNRYVAHEVARELGLDEYFAEVLPQEKVSKVREIQARGMTVAMTGDGVNDAPALAQADVGIAIGAGTDVAVESADIILVRSNPMDVVSILGLAKGTYRKMAQNLLWATGYNVFAIPLAAGVLYPLGLLLTPALGAVLMSLSTVIVAINARFLKL
jgi:Cu2+-exporting ATPase